MEEPGSPRGQAKATVSGEEWGGDERVGRASASILSSTAFGVLWFKLGEEVGGCSPERCIKTVLENLQVP